MLGGILFTTVNLYMVELRSYMNLYSYILALILFYNFLDYLERVNYTDPFNKMMRVGNANVEASEKDSSFADMLGSDTGN